MRTPRHPVHRGSVDASGVFIAAGGGGEASLRERALSLWGPGSAVHRTDGGLVVLFASPRRLSTRASPGAPLVRQGEVLSSAPLSPDELQPLGARPGNIVLVRGGQARAHEISSTTLEDPARWLELTPFDAVTVQGLGAAPAPVPEALQRVNLALRERLSASGVPQEAPEVAQALAALKDAEGRAAPESSGLRAFAGRVLRALARLVSRKAPAEAATQERRLASAPADGIPELRPSWRARLGDWLHRAAVRAALASGLAQVLGARQAEYVRRMMSYFEDGDLDQALRHAIPLGGGGEDATRPAFGVPRPREDLRISLGARSSGAAIGATGELMQELRALYRRAFDRLARAGQVERAAFILAELLGDSEEAVAFLERHGHLRLAAELAESRELSPSLVVRQWFLAGDLERALAVARRTGAFADALLRLRTTHPERAHGLALLWAEALAEAGDYWKAADVAWGTPGAMELVLSWLDRAIEVGGPTGARALVRRLSADAETFEKLRPRALALLQAPPEEDAGSRRAFSEELMAISRKTGHALSPPLAVLARGAVRALARDAGEGSVWVGRRELELLARLADEPALEADLPPLAPLRPARGEPLAHRAGVPGQQRIQDSALLPGGRLLVALGEAGAELCTRDGRRVYRFDVPAHSLVISDHGDRAIAVAPRGELKLLSRLDLISGRAERWCEAPLRAFAKDFDGDVWFASETGALLAVDARAAELKALWRLPRLPGGVLGIARRPGQCQVLVQTEGGAERWALELPSYTLRDRVQVPAPPEDAIGSTVVCADGLVACADFHGLLGKAEGSPGVVTQSLRLVRSGDEQRELSIGSVAAIRSPAVGVGYVAAFSPSAEGILVTVVDAARVAVAARVELPGAKHAAVRFTGDQAVLSDDIGRVVVLDLERGRVLAEVRR